MSLSEFYGSEPTKPYAKRIQDANPNVFRSFRQFALQGHTPPKGSFVYACLTNDLSLTLGKADDQMSEVIDDVVLYLNNCIPIGCWGSEDTIQNWEGLTSDMSEDVAVKIAKDSGM